jgi:hypothetical protein
MIGKSEYNIVKNPSRKSPELWESQTWGHGEIRFDTDAGGETSLMSKTA